MKEEQEKICTTTDEQEFKIVSEEDEILDTDEKILSRWDSMMWELEMYCDLEKKYGPDTTIGEIRKKFGEECSHFMYEHNLEPDEPYYYGM